MKVRLYRGPLDGKILTNQRGDEIVVQGNKKVSRQALWEYQQNREAFDPERPLVRCIYRKIKRPMISQSAYAGHSIVVSDVVCMHPDGSFFYEYVRTIAEYPKKA